MITRLPSRRARALAVSSWRDRAQGFQEFLGQSAVSDDLQHVPDRIVQLDVALVRLEQQHRCIEDLVQVRHQFRGDSPPRE
jgi:hypothetical protein